MTDDDIHRGQAERNQADAYGDAYRAAVSPNWEPDDPRTFPAQEALVAAMETPFDARRRASLFAALADIAAVRAAEEGRLTDDAGHPG